MDGGKIRADEEGVDFPRGGDWKFSVFGREGEKNPTECRAIFSIFPAIMYSGFSRFLFSDSREDTIR